MRVCASVREEERGGREWLRGSEGEFVGVCACC